MEPLCTYINITHYYISCKLPISPRPGVMALMTNDHVWILRSRSMVTILSLVILTA